MEKVSKFAGLNPSPFTMNLKITSRLWNMLGIVVCCLLPGLNFAETIQVDENLDAVAVTLSVEYYEDSSEALSIDDVLATSFDVNFIPHDRDLLHFGMMFVKI